MPPHPPQAVPLPLEGKARSVSASELISGYLTGLKHGPVFFAVGLSMICDKVGERKQSVLGRVPKQRAHGEVVVLSLAYSKLFSEILEGIEGV